MAHRGQFRNFPSWNGGQVSKNDKRIVSMFIKSSSIAYRDGSEGKVKPFTPRHYPGLIDLSRKK